MNNDLAKIDSDMNGKGMKKARDDYEIKNILKWSKETEKRNKHMKKHPEDDDSINDGLCEICRELYKDKIKLKVKKKRKKRYRKLWGNCVPLDKYRCNLLINQERVLDRRKKRYEAEKYLYKEFVISRKEKAEVFQATVKDDSLKSFYGKPYERKCNGLGYERDAPAINQFFAVDGSGVAAESENLNSIQICRQSPAIECTPNFVIGTTCLTSETNPKSSAESFSIVSDSRSLENFVYSSSEVACFDSEMPAKFLNFPNNLNNSSHVSSVGFETREFSFTHENSVFFVGMRSLKQSYLNQIDFTIIELKQTLKQDFELLLNRGRLFYTKSGLFGINISNSYQFGCEVFKLAPTAQPRWSNQIQLSQHRDYQSLPCAPCCERWI
jgi:hypothetical protein